MSDIRLGWWTRPVGTRPSAAGRCQRRWPHQPPSPASSLPWLSQASFCCLHHEQQSLLPWPSTGFAVQQAPAVDYRLNLVAGQEASGPYLDGGIVDRTGLQPWRQHLRLQQQGISTAHGNGGGGGGSSSGGGGGLQQAPPAIVHLIARSSKYSGSDDVAATGARGLDERNMRQQSL